MTVALTLVTWILQGVHGHARTPAFPGAEGFGAHAKGGRGGDVYHVTNLADSGEGSLRYGIESTDGPRTIVFDVSGTIALKSMLRIRKPYITIAGQTAPGDGICLRDYSMNISRTRDIIVRYIRLRRGDVYIREAGRPSGSSGLDVVSIDDSKNVIFDHVSLSWSCDEVFGIVQNENVTVQWCIVSEPLGDPALHPYGNSHAYGLNDSANTLSVHHCLVSNYVMRGPEFEPNDAVSGQGYDVHMEAVNNVLFDYKKSGSRYKTGIENNPSAAAGIAFRFHFVNNYYIRNRYSSGPEIHAVDKHGVTDQLKVYVAGNIGPFRPRDDMDPWRSVYLENGTNVRFASTAIQNQMSDELLFACPTPVTVDDVETAYARVIQSAGCSIQRDAVDNRIISDVIHRRYSDYLRSQEQVGGWPLLNSAPAPPDTDQDGMPDWWEDEQGLDRQNAADRNHDPDGDGYTHLEDYLAAIVVDPGALVVPGDCNGDGALDISDSVCVFLGLFSGETETLPCGSSLAAPGNINLIDWQADGKVNLADGIALLQFFFSDGVRHALAISDATDSCVNISGCAAPTTCQ